MHTYLIYNDFIDLSSNFHVKDLKKLFHENDCCVALYINGEFHSYYDISDFYQLGYDLDFNDICLGIYVSDHECYFVVNFGEFEV